MTSRPPSPWDQASIRTADTRKRENTQRHAGHANAREERPLAREGGSKQELRYYGLNAVQAVFAKRPEAIRKVYLTESRIPHLQPLLAWCVQQRIGYRVVADVLRVEPRALSAWLDALPAGPALALWLDGVGNPHNLGAILRSSAHFGVAAILQPRDSILALSGAAARVAEGGAEQVPMVRMGDREDALAQLRGAGFQLAATVVRGGSDLFKARLPQRLVYVMGAEGEGMDAGLAAGCELGLSIPGSGAVESLNVAAATAVFLAEWRRQREAT